MNNLEIITMRVVSYCDIPEELSNGKFFDEYGTGCYVECHLDNEPDDELDKWLKSNYPGIEEDPFLIKIDY